MKTHPLTRRQMIARSAAALPAFAPHLAPLFADEKSRGFRIGACEWSLRKGDPSSMDLAREIGIDGVQVAMGTVENNDIFYEEIRVIKGRVCEFHAKDGKFMLGEGRVDFKKVREAMDEIDYRGWIQIEAAAPANLITDYQAHLALLKTHFPLSA